MSGRRHRAAAALLLALLAVATRAAPVARYEGLCDASAAVALDDRHFVVASDEDDTLRVYRRDAPAVVAEWPMKDFLGGDRHEADLEGAARIGDRIYWIGSHGRNAAGKPRPARQRLFATAVLPPPAPGQPPALRPVGRPFGGLLAAMAEAPALRGLSLDAAAALPPEAPGGLNIEGLAADAGGGLLIGLRNPIPNGRAIVVPLANPAAVVEQGAAPVLGEPLLLPLRNRGVRSLERIGDGWFVVAGPTADRGSFSLYRWPGGTRPPVLADAAALAELRPEALFAWPDGSLQVLSDDGGLEVDGVECKRLPPARQGFRSVTLVMPPR